ncbi:XXYS1_4_G0027790.mRNA.1.CDS.1 [Saccharomyces cerevisiae]|nr:EM14S01-3B_G0025200.mRNA.1.CDS.1 [Saccharomyces cerevisiae]CAD6642335.1 XXYS1_4_G0027790.mRNA.1.CDS.1 [Saccharomyces cerevisiae]CAI4650840.1 AMH_1a_G0043130.mRNA.1.CDS.1 [Saccharomyces cerevisiae]CAI4655307.1 CEI_1a_G0043050.mRNA.1.CDS.1 [Saccharomyces cerevisiae]CAI6815057.1 AMH_1a_G0043130.mRNA.1.CDS.1 [Saccharomyces cerevisiae]
MRFSNFLTVSALLTGALGAPAVRHKHEKRDVVTATVHAQVTVVVSGNSGETIVPVNENAVVAATSSTAVASQATTSTLEPTTSANVVTSQQQTSTLESSDAASTVGSSTSSSPSSSSSTSSSASSSASSSISASGAKGITYSPYNDDGSCKSTAQVASDLEQLTGFDNIRLYGVDCSQVENVLQAKTSSQKLFLGIYYVDKIQDAVDTIKSAVESYGSWDDITTVSVGNELVNGGSATTTQVGEYVSTAKSALTSAGYTGSVVSVDTFIAVINNPDLCNYSDYMAVNAHAYFDENTAAQDAGPWVLEQIERVYTACGGKKDVVITETGWPSKGDTYGEAVPSKANQEAAISSIKSSCGSSAYLFTAFNDLWKDDGQYGVEKYWGILSSD